ncbi:uncharacterized protein LOC120639754 isoform X2 [Panicum virgatum]|uniref:uncharacterized protein LOC120639754 isoform X2 n=1 Tax=Panicum virgatum TaxID=38727 RepID=UPI0019D608EE|nr:uncharacterized protein LOC120639754 isoform X2 [Panicum virgatum]
MLDSLSGDCPPLPTPERPASASNCGRAPSSPPSPPSWRFLDVAPSMAPIEDTTLAAIADPGSRSKEYIRDASNMFDRMLERCGRGIWWFRPRVRYAIKS